MTEMIQRQEPEAVPTNPAGNGSQFQSPEPDQGAAMIPINPKLSGQPPIGKITGS
jgi:hypothetical protein